MIADTRAGGGSRVLDQEQTAIETKDLVADYGRKRAVDGLSLRVPVWSVYGFLGPNGAGKTTTIKTLLGFRGLDGGSASVHGDLEAAERALRDRPHRVVDIDSVGMTLEGIFVAYVEDEDDR